MSGRIDTESESDTAVGSAEALGTKVMPKAKTRVRGPTSSKESTKPKVQGSGKQKKKTGLRSLKKSKRNPRIPTSSASGDSSSLQSSPESKRIQAAALRAKTKAKLVPVRPKTTYSEEQCSESLSSDSDASGEGAQVPSELPASSGVFDYMSWAVAHILTSTEKQALGRYRTSTNEPIAIGSMCAGMATEDIALKGIANALLQHDGLNLHISHAFKAESAPEKLSFLRRHSREAGQHLFIDNAVLQEPFPKTADGKVVERPKCTVLLCGIVCTCISGLNTTNPKSEREDGASGKALSGLLASLTAMPFEQRPELLILECVARLGHKRHVDPDSRRGTEFIAAELYTLGYVGQWRKVTPTSFYLPQGRPRVYAMFLKRVDFADGSLTARQQDLQRGLAIILRMQIGQYEPLEKVLGRCPEPQPKNKRPYQKPAGHMPKWPSQHNKYAEQQNIPVADRQPSEEFYNIVGPLLPNRSLHALWLRLAGGKNRGLNWQQGTWVATLGASLRFMSLRKDVFPCVTPHQSYGVMRNGKFHVANGLTLLAMQGVQSKELEAFNLKEEDPALLHDFAGNAFTANIVAAFLLAGLVVM